MLPSNWFNLTLNWRGADLGPVPFRLQPLVWVAVVAPAATASPSVSYSGNGCNAAVSGKLRLLRPAVGGNIQSSANEQWPETPFLPFFVRSFPSLFFVIEISKNRAPGCDSRGDASQRPMAIFSDHLCKLTSPIVLSGGDHSKTSGNCSSDYLSHLQRRDREWQQLR